MPSSATFLLGDFLLTCIFLGNLFFLDNLLFFLRDFLFLLDDFLFFGNFFLDGLLFDDLLLDGFFLACLLGIVLAYVCLLAAFLATDRRLFGLDSEGAAIGRALRAGVHDEHFARLVEETGDTRGLAGDREFHRTRIIGNDHRALKDRDRGFATFSGNVHAVFGAAYADRCGWCADSQVFRRKFRNLAAGDDEGTLNQRVELRSFVVRWIEDEFIDHHSLVFAERKGRLINKDYAEG